MRGKSSATPCQRACLLMAAAAVFFLFYLGAQPAASGLVPAHWDKLAHLAVYSVITALLWIGTAGRMTLAVLAVVVSIGALDEVRQISLHGRSADALDFLADACAGVATSTAMLLYARKSKRDQ